jgi:hypothetical protein
MPINYIAVTCSQCGGSGGPRLDPCAACDGTGKVTVPARLGREREPSRLDWICMLVGLAIFAALVIWMLSHHGK